MSEASKRVLVVEDDEFFRQALINTLNDNNIETLEASNGKEARDVITENSCDLVLSDVQMPHCSGTELLEWVRRVYDRSFKVKREMPFVLMTGFAHILETQKAHDLGIKNFLTKPFSDDELIDVLKPILGLSEAKEMAESSESTHIKEYCKVSLEDFVSDRDIDMDVYIKLSDKKYVKVAHKGGKLPLEQVERYKEKGVTQLYIRREDFRKVIDFNIKLSKLVAGSQLNEEKKHRFMIYTGDIILENTFVNGVDDRVFSDSKDFLMTCMDVLTGDEETFNLLESLNSHSDSLYSHSLGVSMYSVMIAKALGWTSTSNLFKLAFGGLMHDVGKKEIDPEILDKSRAALSFTERKTLETHPLRGKEILTSLKSAPSEVVSIAYEHHETCLGHGFPRKITKNQIHPMARIVSIANEFCGYALRNKNHPGVEAKKAFYLVEQYKKDDLDQEFYKGLKAIIK